MGMGASTGLVKPAQSSTGVPAQGGKGQTATAGYPGMPPQGGKGQPGMVPAQGGKAGLGPYISQIQQGPYGANINQPQVQKPYLNPAVDNNYASFPGSQVPQVQQPFGGFPQGYPPVGYPPAPPNNPMKPIGQSFQDYLTSYGRPPEIGAPPPAMDPMKFSGPGQPLPQVLPAQTQPVAQTQTVTQPAQPVMPRREMDDDRRDKFENRDQRRMEHEQRRMEHDKERMMRRNRMQQQPVQGLGLAGLTNPGMYK